MTTCNDCGKFNPEKRELGNHWICGDCKEEPKELQQNHNKKEDE